MIEYKTSYFYFFLIRAVALKIARAICSRLSHLNGKPVPHKYLSLYPSKKGNNWRKELSKGPEKWRFELKKKNAIVFKDYQPPHWLDPWYVVGLTEAEGCFSTFYTSDFKIGCEFSLSLFNTDASIIKSLYYFFGVGSLRVTGNCLRFEVKRDWLLWHRVIPFFDQYPLLGDKRRSFALMKQVLSIKRESSLLKSPKTRKMAKLKIALLIDTYYTFSTKTKKLNFRQIVNKLGLQPSDIHVDWWDTILIEHFMYPLAAFVSPEPKYITGLSEGDGGSLISFGKNSRGYDIVRHSFTIGLSQFPILLMLKRYFNMGTIYKIQPRPLYGPQPKLNPSGIPVLHWRFIIFRRDELFRLNKIHFRKYPMYCSKKDHYDALMLALTRIQYNWHKDPVKRQQMEEEFWGVNRGGRFRKKPDPKIIQTIRYNGHEIDVLLPEELPRGSAKVDGIV